MISEITKKLIDLAVEEDLAGGDITSNALIQEDFQNSAKIVAKEDLVVCGQEIAKEVCSVISSKINYDILVEDGARVSRGDIISRVTGSYRAILASERTCLNFLQRLCAISTRARIISDKAKRFGVKILDTRKTTPGWRQLEKYAVSVGGATNHRMGLYDAVMIKDNHVDAFAGTLKEALTHCRSSVPEGTKIEIEVRNLKELGNALEGKPDCIMLDNMTPEEVKNCVSVVRDVSGGEEIEIEVSGGINEDNFVKYLSCGANSISMGVLTHSVKSADLALYMD